jgi:hypothetical protein
LHGFTEHGVAQFRPLGAYLQRRTFMTKRLLIIAQISLGILTMLLAWAALRIEVEALLTQLMQTLSLENSPIWRVAFLQFGGGFEPYRWFIFFIGFCNATIGLFSLLIDAKEKRKL